MIKNVIYILVMAYIPPSRRNNGLNNQNLVLIPLVLILILPKHPRRLVLNHQRRFCRELS